MSVVPGRGNPIQRSWVRLKLLSDRRYAAGARWCAVGMLSSKTELEAMQARRLSALVSMFRERGLCEPPARGQAPLMRELEDLQGWPILGREDLRRLYPRLKEFYDGRRDVSSVTSGGATGEPVQFMHSRTQARLAGGCNLRMYQVLGWQPGMTRLALWVDMRGIGHDEDQPKGAMGRLRRYLRQTYHYGGFAPGEEEYKRFLEAIRRHPGSAVYGFSSLLEECARLMIERGWTLPEGFLSTMWNTAEMMVPRQSEVVQRAFGVKPRQYYASRECTAIAAECECGNLHVSPRYVVEAVDLDTHAPLSSGETGSLLVTDLFNDATPFIRYELGDMGAVEWRDCACGRRGPCLTSFAGRVAWLIRLPSGKGLTSLVFNAIIDYVPSLQQWAVVRTAPSRFEMRYTGPTLEPKVHQEFAAMLGKALEGTEVRILRVDELDRTPSGKLLQYHDLTGMDGSRDSAVSLSELE